MNDEFTSGTTLLPSVELLKYPEVLVELAWLMKFPDLTKNVSQ